MNEAPRFWIARGAVLLQLRHFDETARCLRVGIDMKPHHGEADARLFLADALWGVGRKVLAGAEWMTVSKMSPPTPVTSSPYKRRNVVSRSALRHDVEA